MGRVLLPRLASPREGLTLMENSIFNSWRMEGVWLDK